MKKLARLLGEPLVHFLIIGAALFVWFHLTQRPQLDATKTIVVTPGQVERLASQFRLTWMRPPTDDELAGLIEGHVRSEVYYREALAMGLDRDDPFIRRRMQQKLEFILDDLTGVKPDEAALRAFLRQHPESFRWAPQITFRQVYLDPQKHADVVADADQMLADLNAGAAPQSFGDPTLAAGTHALATKRDITRWFGNSFAERVIAMQPGQWEGPFDSALGTHLVQVTERREGRMPQLEEVRSQVEREYLAKRRQENREAAYARLREKYAVIRQPPTAGEETSEAAFASTPPGAVER